MARSAEQLYVVDRREGDVCVLVTDAGASIDVAAKRLPPSCRAEGVVMRVPMSDSGEPSWNDARRDRDEERRRLDDANERIKRLGKTDPGGDVTM
ncbi:MAG TPA: DUF3006 family protein [Gemmatimonadaceae bacterium]|jgi:hypothetical protein